MGTTVKECASLMSLEIIKSKIPKAKKSIVHENISVQDLLKLILVEIITDIGIKVIWSMPPN